jgi:hypothetical protein
VVIVTLALLLSSLFVATTPDIHQRRRPPREERVLHGRISIPLIFLLESDVALASLAFSTCFGAAVLTFSNSDGDEWDTRAVSSGGTTAAETSLVFTSKAICYGWGFVGGGLDPIRVIHSFIHSFLLL